MGKKRVAAVLAAFLSACSSKDTTNTQDLATVATTGDYSDLKNAPDLTAYARTSSMAKVSTTGDYKDLTGAPDLSQYATIASLSKVSTTGDYKDLSGAPDLSQYAASSALAKVATTGSYQDLSNAPDLTLYAKSADLAAVASSGSYADLANRPDLTVYARSAQLAAVAQSGAYSDLSGAPDLTPFARSSQLAEVATSGTYASLSGAPWTSAAGATTTSLKVGIGTSAPSQALQVMGGLDTELTIDQASLEDGTLFDAATSAWQSFTAGVTASVVALMVHPWWTNPADGYTLTFFQGEGTSGNVLASFSGVHIAPGSGPTTFTIQLPTPVAVTAGSVYTWQLTNASAFSMVGYPWASYSRGHCDQHIGSNDAYEFATYYYGPATALSVDASSGYVGVGTASPAAKLDVAGNGIRIRTPRSPASSDACKAGEVAWDSDYVYVCVADNTWRRSGLSAY